MFIEGCMRCEMRNVSTAYHKVPTHLRVGEVGLTGDSPDRQVECAAGFPIVDLNSEDVVVSSPVTQSGTLLV